MVGVFYTCIFVLGVAYVPLYVGGDAIPWFFTDAFLSTAPFLWNVSAGFGGVATSPLLFFQYWVLLPFLWLAHFSPAFAQYALHYTLWMCMGLSMFACAKLYTKEHWSSVVVSMMYTLSYVIAIPFWRNVLFLSALYALTPLLIYLCIRYISEDISPRAKALSAVLLFPWIGVIAGNPIYCIMCVFTVFVIVVPHVTSFRGAFRRLALPLAIVAVPLVCAVTVHALFMKYNHALQDDYWNTVVLTQMPLERQAQYQHPLQALRGISTDTFDTFGYRDGAPYAPFRMADHKDSALVYAATWLPLVVILSLLAYLSFYGAIRGIHLYFVAVFFCAVVLFKSSAAPFGDVFSSALTDHPLLRMLRSPHQKIAVLFALSQTLLFGVLVTAVPQRVRRVALFVVCGAVCVANQYYFTNGALQETLQVHAIPDAYHTVASYMERAQLGRAVVLPHTVGTWELYSYGYEGYSPFSYIAPTLQIQSRQALAFAAPNLWFYNVGDSARLFPSQMEASMELYAIDAVIFDGYVDRYPRFHEDAGGEVLLAWLKKQTWLTQVFMDGKLVVFQVKDMYRKPKLFVSGGSSVAQPALSGGYAFDAALPASGGTIVMLQSYHGAWGVYLEEVSDTTTPCADAEKTYYRPYHSTLCSYEHVLQTLWRDVSVWYSGYALSARHTEQDGYGNAWVVSADTLRAIPSQFVRQDSEGVHLQGRIIFVPNVVLWVVLLCIAFVGCVIGCGFLVHTYIIQRI